MLRTPLLEHELSGYPPVRDVKVIRSRPPFWRTRRGVVCIIVFAMIVIGALVGIIFPGEKPKPKQENGHANDTIPTTGVVAGVSDSGVAAVTWQNDGLHIRVYFQKNDAFVYEATWDQGIGWNSVDNKLFQAKVGTPLAAIAFAPTQVQIRLYSLNDSNALQEYAYNGGWQQGSSLPFPNLSPTTSLAAVTWAQSTSDQEIRVYYQKQDNTLQEIGFSPGPRWTATNSFMDQAYPGTGLGAILATDNNNSPSLRVYWQGSDLSLNEYDWAGGWSSRKLNWSPAPSSGIAAASWTDSSGNPFVRVYFENTAGIIQEVGYNTPSGWVVGPNDPTDTVVGSQTPISAILWVNGSDTEIRAYVKSNSSDTHTEFAYSGSWTSNDLSF